MFYTYVFIWMCAHVHANTMYKYTHACGRNRGSYQVPISIVSHLTEPKYYQLNSSYWSVSSRDPPVFVVLSLQG